MSYPCSKVIFMNKSKSGAPGNPSKSNRIGSATIHQGDCLEWLAKTRTKWTADMIFLDPPFNQGHAYRYFDDSQTGESYWGWMQEVLRLLREKTSPGGAIYFMQREKNAEFVLSSLRETGWSLQNLIIWKKKASAVPSSNRFGKHYQIIAMATNGDRPRVFNRLRIDLPLLPEYRHSRKNGVYVTDVWDDIRELTSGYFAGSEPVRKQNGERFHKEQSPIALLARIILSSTRPGDVVLDPFAGTGTTLVAAEQLKRKSVGMELDPKNVKCIKDRIARPRPADSVEKLYDYYRYTKGIDSLWGKRKSGDKAGKVSRLDLRERKSA